MKSLTPNQKKFVNLLKKPDIHEAKCLPDGYEVKTRAGKIHFKKAEIDPLLAEGYLVKIPSRWGTGNEFVFMDVERRADLIQRAKRARNKPEKSRWMTPAQQRMLLYLTYDGPIDARQTPGWCDAPGRTMRTGKCLVASGHATRNGSVFTAVSPQYGALDED